MKWLVLKIIGLIGLWGLVLGAHGLYVCFSRWEVLFGENTPEMLFLALKLPFDFLSSQVYWMSEKGFEAWFIPAIIGGIGGWLVKSCLFEQ